MINNYNIQESMKVPIILNLPSREGLRFVETLNDQEKQQCKTGTGLFKIKCDKFKCQYNKVILSLQYCKLTRKQNKNTEEWRDQLQMKRNECSFKEKED